MKPCERDWSFLANKGLKLEIAQNQNRMELFDDQLPGSGKPIQTIAALCMILVFAVAAVTLVLHFADMIDNRPAVNLKLAGR